MVRNLTVAVLASLVLAAPASAASPDVTISQVYGGGGNSGATYTHDFIELYNASGAPVSLVGWSVQYASAAGTSWQVTPLSGSIAPGAHYLVQEAAGAGGTQPLPEPDATGSIAMSGTSGKVALRTSTVACDADCVTTSRDFVGYGAASAFEGAAPAPGLSNTTAALRAEAGATDTDDNAADFTAGAPDPRNSGEGGGAAIESSDPADGAEDVPAGTTITVTFTEPVENPRFTLECGGATQATAVGGSGRTYTVDPVTDLPSGSECRLTVAFEDGGTAGIGFTTRGIEGLRIHDIQGPRHISPYRNALVAGVPGVVTALRVNGFFYQDPSPDGDDRTSEGLFVFTSTPPAVTVGQAVTVSGRVAEFRPGGGANLTTTEITAPVVTRTGTGTIAPTVVGRGGRVPPNTIIDDDTVDPGGEDPTDVGGDVEANATFDPQEDGIDFHESLEGMLTQIDNAVATGPTSDFGSNRELPVVADGGANANVLSSRGALVVRGFDQRAPQEYRRGDFNPERLILNDANDPRGAFLPDADVRDRFTGPVRAVVDYSFGNFKYLVVNEPALRDGGLQPERTRPRDGKRELAIAGYNVENLDGADPQERYDRIARQITVNLRSPDILSLEEVQDDDGAASPAPTQADVTYARLIAAIRAAGGPRYDYRQIDPAPASDGGEPGGNIRVGFLFRTDRRDLEFVDRPGGTATTATEAVRGPGGARLTFSPGRIDPTNAVWASSRKPLAGEFRYQGKPLFVVGNHFNSKGGDDPVFGRFQEPRRPSELQRRGSATDPADTTRGQAGVVNAWVRRLLDVDRRARVVVLGDLNDFDFSETLRVLEEGDEVNGDRELVNLFHLLPRSERYTYVFQGNGQVLDHILVSPWLLLRERPDLDVVHINAEFADQASDHDPPITRLGAGDFGLGGWWGLLR